MMATQQYLRFDLPKNITWCSYRFPNYIIAFYYDDGVPGIYYKAFASKDEDNPTAWPCSDALNIDILNRTGQKLLPGSEKLGVFDNCSVMCFWDGEPDSGTEAVNWSKWFVAIERDGWVLIYDDTLELLVTFVGRSPRLSRWGIDTGDLEREHDLMCFYIKKNAYGQDTVRVRYDYDILEEVGAWARETIFSKHDIPLDYIVLGAYREDSHLFPDTPLGPNKYHEINCMPLLKYDQKCCAKENVSVNPEYKVINFIEADGTGQYINLDIIPNINTSLEIDFSQGADLFAWLAGQRNSPLNQDFSVGMYNLNAQFHFANQQKEYNITTSSHQRRTIKISKEGGYIDGELVTDAFTGTLVGEHPIYVFGINDAGALYKTDGENIRIYGVKLWKGDVLWLDLIPVLYETGSHEFIPCLYDRVWEKYYLNSGSGDFAYG